MRTIVEKKKAKKALNSSALLLRFCWFIQGTNESKASTLLPIFNRPICTWHETNAE